MEMVDHPVVWEARWARRLCLHRFCGAGRPGLIFFHVTSPNCRSIPRVPIVCRRRYCSRLIQLRVVGEFAELSCSPRGRQTSRVSRRHSPCAVRWVRGQMPWRGMMMLVYDCDGRTAASTRDRCEPSANYETRELGWRDFERWRCTYLACFILYGAIVILVGESIEPFENKLCRDCTKSHIAKFDVRRALPNCLFIQHESTRLRFILQLLNCNSLWITITNLL